MSTLGDSFERFCTNLSSIPAAVLCVFVFILQEAVINYYLVHHIGSSHLAWMAGDAVALVLLVLSITLSLRTLANQKVDGNAETRSIAWLAWLVIYTLFSAKVIVIFENFSVELYEEKTFFAPNTLKTTIALCSAVFLLLLATQHDAPQASERKKYIEDVTSTVFIDLIDTTDILEILVNANDRRIISNSMEMVVLGAATLNLILPTVPLGILSATKFGHAKIRKGNVYLHSCFISLAVNMPNLLVRLILWHGFSVGISPFILKNFILIGMALSGYYEHKVEEYEEREREREMELLSRKTPKLTDRHIMSVHDSKDMRCHVDGPDEYD